MGFKRTHTLTGRLLYPRFMPTHGLGNDSSTYAKRGHARPMQQTSPHKSSQKILMSVSLLIIHVQSLKVLTSTVDSLVSSTSTITSIIIRR